MACGLQALGLAASAYDTVRQYAKERVQGTPFTNRDADRVPIIKHEDVRRMLMNLKAGSEAMRAMNYFQEGKLPLIPLSSTLFLECFAETVLAQFILEQGLIARDKLKEVDAGSADGVFYRGKMETTKFFCRNILPNVFARHTVLQQEDTSALDIPEEAF
jgi:alkylation response protein AidB-like acyl-CoA dehydrogenase